MTKEKETTTTLSTIKIVNFAVNEIESFLHVIKTAVRDDENSPRQEPPEIEISTTYIRDVGHVSTDVILQKEFFTFLASLTGADRYTSSSYPLPSEWNELTQPNSPMVYVSALDAEGFCKRMGYRLPTEHEWEKIRQHAESAKGVRLSGFYEWTADSVMDGGVEHRVLRGGPWLSNRDFARASFRDRYNPAYRCYDVGFRVVLYP